MYVSLSLSHHLENVFVVVVVASAKTPPPSEPESHQSEPVALAGIWRMRCKAGSALAYLVWK